MSYLRAATFNGKSGDPNIKASVSLKAIGGKEVRVEDAPWFKNVSSRAPGACYHEGVNLGMLESASVVCVIRSADDKFHTALYSDEMRVRSGVPLAFGQWDVEVHVDGDNVGGTYQFRMQLLPNGAVGFVPVNSLPEQAK